MHRTAAPPADSSISATGTSLAELLPPGLLPPDWWIATLVESLALDGDALLEESPEEVCRWFGMNVDADAERRPDTLPKLGEDEISDAVLLPPEESELFAPKPSPTR